MIYRVVLEAGIQIFNAYVDAPTIMSAIDKTIARYAAVNYLQATTINTTTDPLVVSVRATPEVHLISDGRNEGK